MAERADLLIKGWYVVTMNERRDIIRDGAVVWQVWTAQACARQGQCEHFGCPRDAQAAEAAR